MEGKQDKRELYTSSMDPLETPLNYAHQQHRKSECHMRAGRLKEAILAHQKAVEFLEEALLKAESDKGRQSIEFQLAFHRRQQEVIKVKMQRIEEWQNNNCSEELADIVGPLAVSNHELHSTILKVLDEHDSLLQVLNKNQNSKMTKSDSRVSELVNNQQNNDFKKPKDNSMIIEELKYTNQELRKLIDQLYSELETARHKNKELMLALDEQNKTIHDLRLGKPPLSEFVSPYGFSPLCELSPGGGIRDLPHLPPLEFPKFDYEMLLKATSNQTEQ